MGFILIIIGTVFLFNPMVALLDILPDFIGYLLILIGIYKLADITKKMENIHKYLIYLICISLARTILMFVMNDAVLSLIFVSLFAVCEAVFMFSFYNKLFDGIDDIGITFGIFDTFKKSSELKTLTYVFILVRSLFTIIPEFRHLTMTEYEGEISSYDMTGRFDYSYMLILLNLIVVTIIGIAWLYMMITFLRRLQKNTPFIENLRNHYEKEVLSDTKRFFKRRIIISILLLMAGFVFLFDIYIDNIDMIPDFIGGGFIVAALYTMLKDNENIKNTIYFAAIYIPVSLAGWIYQIIFNSHEYRVKSLLKSDVLTSYIGLIAVMLIASVILCVIFTAIRKHFDNLINKLIVYEYETHFHKLIEEQNESIKKKNINNIIIFIISILFAISKIVQTSMTLLMPGYWMIHFVIEIVWMFRMYMFVTDIYEEVKYRLGTGVE